MTVRYLVRSPITLDESAVDEVSSGQPYRIAHAISEDSLVVEVRLEAPSYMRLDTVVAVARGGSEGPFRFAMAPREGRVASRPASARPQPTRAQPEASAATIDRSGLTAGDQAFSAGDWRGASDGYARMPLPPAGADDYAREFFLTRVRLGIARINLGEWDGARAALQDAVNRDPTEYSGYFYLGQVQCTLGQFSTGRQTLSQVERHFQSISEAQRPVVLALVEYQRAVCSHSEFQAARSPADQARTRQQALADLEDFVSRAESLNPIPQPVQAAMADARRRMVEIGTR